MDSKEGPPRRKSGSSRAWRTAMDAATSAGVLKGFKTLRDMHIDSIINFDALELVESIGGARHSHNYVACMRSADLRSLQYSASHKA
jgi:hypothetical protein